MGGERRKLFGESNKLFLVAVFAGGGPVMEGDWAELRTVRDVSHWVNDPVQVQGNRGMGVSMRPHTVSQHHSGLAPRPEPNLNKHRGALLFLSFSFIFMNPTSAFI